MQRLVRLALAGVAVAALVFAATALAGTKTINDNNDHLAKCLDIHKVVGHAGNKVSKFTITMLGNVKAKPCKGKAAPSVDITLKNGMCSAFIYQGKQVLNCEGAPGGSAKVAISRKDNHVWTVSFATKELGKQSSFKFSVHCGISLKQSDDTLDVTHNKQVTIRVG